MISYHTSPLAALGGKHSGGMNVYVRELGAQLAKRGHQVDVFTRGNEFEEQQIGNGARLISLRAGLRKEIEKSKLAAYIPEFMEQVINFANREKYDLIHAHYWMSGLVGLDLKAKWGVPMVMMF